MLDEKIFLLVHFALSQTTHAAEIENKCLARQNHYESRWDPFRLSFVKAFNRKGAVQRFCVDN